MGNLTIEYRVISEIEEGASILDIIPAEEIQAEAKKTGFEVLSTDDTSFSFTRPQSKGDETLIAGLEKFAPNIDKHFRVQAAQGLKKDMESDDHIAIGQAIYAAQVLEKHQFCSLKVEDTKDGQKAVVSLDLRPK